MAVAFVSASTPEPLGAGTSAAVTMPPSPVVGNIVVVHLFGFGSTMAAPPAGWTLRGVDTNDFAALTHVIDGTESWFAGGGTVTFTATVRLDRGFSAQYSGVDASNPIGEIVTGKSGSAFSTVSLSLTGNAPTDSVVAYAPLTFTARINNTTPTGYTSRIGGASSVYGHLFTKAIATPETPTGISVSLNGSSNVQTAALYSLLPVSSTSATVNSVRAQATATAPAPAVTGKRNATAAAAVVTASALALAPVVTGSARVSPPAATAAAAAPTPSVLGVQNVVVHPPDAAASVGALSPIISAVGSATVTVPGVTQATGQTYPPAVTATRNATVQSSKAAATAAALAPTAHGGAQVAATTTTATAGTFSPVILGQQNGVVLAVSATTTATANPPTVEVRVPAEPPPAERIYTIDASGRTVAIAASDRTVIIPASNRTIGVRP